MSLTLDLVKSWKETERCCNSLDTVLDWIKEKNDKLEVSINRIDFTYNDGDWYLDSTSGQIRNKGNTFFQISGLVEEDSMGNTVNEQPVIIQNEIGFLGIICHKINGVLHFLMQCKIEPGNLNKIQISPTIQATKSNFTQKHGGRRPAYLDYFLNKDMYTVVVDQIQSEQSSRFSKKRNRNIIILVDDKIEVLPSHMWMTLGQIKQLLKFDNIVNMDSRTVLSCLPFFREETLDDELETIESCFSDKSLYNSIFGLYNRELFKNVYSDINDDKMFCDVSTKLVPLTDLKDWELKNNEIVCKRQYPFKIIYCNISIEGREVRQWKQPLLASNGVMIVGLFTSIIDGTRKFLVKLRHESGCFDYEELGPTVQYEYSSTTKPDAIESLFLTKLEEKKNIYCDVLLSEEGGRFYHEQNRNVIIDINSEEIDVQRGYYWVDYRFLNSLIQMNNCMNIQLRNLLVLLNI